MFAVQVSGLLVLVFLSFCSLSQNTNVVVLSGYRLYNQTHLCIAETVFLFLFFFYPYSPLLAVGVPRAE